MAERAQRRSTPLEGIGFPRPFAGQIEILTDILAKTARDLSGAEPVEMLHALAHSCRAAAETGDYAAVDSQIRGLSASQLLWLLRASLNWFELLNTAEKREIVRINRERASAEGDGHPGPESIEESVGQLKARGVPLEELTTLVARLDIQPTLTAHPTETERRTTRLALQRIGRLLEALQRPDRTSVEEAAAIDGLRSEVALLLCTDDLRAEGPEAEAEIEGGLAFPLRAIWDGVPEIYGRVRHAVRRQYGAEVNVPAFLRFRSWMGGDRDGNPNITPEVTRWTLDLHRRVALERHLGELERLREELSLSDRRVPVSGELRGSLDGDIAEDLLDGWTQKRFRHEPYRLKLSAMMARIARGLDNPRGGGAAPRGAYRSAEYLDDLDLIGRSLERAGLVHLARYGRLQRVRWLARSFGFHFASLDIRECSARHAEAVAALLSARGVVADYRSLPEPERQEILAAELAKRRPLLGEDVELPAPARDSLAVLKVVDEAIVEEPRSVDAYVVSMTRAASDALEVLLLAKEAGLWRCGGAHGSAPIDIVPLFETIEDLAGIEAGLADLLSNAAYRRHLEARGNFQEVMIGYSDGNKDGGYWMANLMLYRAQEAVARVCRDHGVSFRLFHGRGGSLEHGGALEDQAILAAAPRRHDGRLRFTEQGEVVSFRYASVAMACRHLEQVTSAVLLAMEREEENGGPNGGRPIDTFASLAEHAMTAYRRLIEKPGFWRWYMEATPIRHIGRLPIASRPVSRGADDEVSFDDLRAIPWIFAWRQSRYAAPGWYGLGSALREKRIDLDALRDLYRDNTFFSLIADNARLEMARTRLDISRRYGALGGAQRAEIHEILEKDFETARKALLRLGGLSDLLEDHHALRKLIAFRNPFVDVLNLVQVELMRRHRRAPPERRPAVAQLMFLSIAAIAAGMESTA